jgi:hypothetical protein
MSAREWMENDPARLIRDGVPPEHASGAAADPQLAAMAAGAQALHDSLSAWEDTEPPADLVERTLAGLALAAHADAGSPAPASEVAEPPAAEGEIVPFPRRRRSTVVERLTQAPLTDVPHEAPTPRRLLFRVVVQAAAAAVLFVVCSSFAVVFYPAVTHALEERDVVLCQEQLRRLNAAALRYRAEHPQGERLCGANLRRALVRGGYASEQDFTCPSRRGRQLGSSSYQGDLPGGVAPVASRHVLFWDTFTNHGTSGFNVVRIDGRVQQVAVDDLGVLWRSRSVQEE